MATEFPECEFIGIDIVSLQPTTVLPSNCSFEMANMFEGLYGIRFALGPYSPLL
jgi:hypothetical protein